MEMLPHNFWHEYSYSDFIIRSHYFYKKQEMAERSQWEKARYLATLPLSLQYGKGNKDDLLRFPWDKVPRVKAVKPLSKAEIEGLLKHYPFLSRNN